MLSYWLWRILWLNDIMFILFTNCEKKQLFVVFKDFLTSLSRWDGKTTTTIPFYLSTAISWGSSLTYHHMDLLFNSNTTGFVSREGPTYHSGVSDFTLGFQCDSCWSMLSCLCTVLSTIVCPFVVFLLKLSHNVPTAVQRQFYVGYIVWHGSELCPSINK